jgi:predicted DNA-binding transcriptional regulator AlpA
MDKEYLTITEIASQLNVSRQYIYKLIEKDDLQEELKKYMVIKNKIKYINVDALTILKNNLKKKDEKKSTHTKNKNKDESDLYKENIDYLKNELEKRDAFYKDLIDDMRKRISFFEEESLKKDKLLENMQVLLKQKEEILQLTDKKNSSIWDFFKKKKNN